MGGEEVLVGRGYWWRKNTGGEEVLVGREYWWGGSTGGEGTLEFGRDFFLLFRSLESKKV